MATRSSILAWRIPMDRVTWRATVHGVAKSQTQLSDQAQHSTHGIYTWLPSVSTNSPVVQLVDSVCQCRRCKRCRCHLGRYLGEGNGNPLQYSCLENSIGRGAWRATVLEVAELDKTEWLSTAQPSLYRHNSHSEPEHGVLLLPPQSLPVSSWLLVQGVNRAFSSGSWVLPRKSLQQTLARKDFLKTRDTVNTRDPPLQVNPGRTHCLQFSCESPLILILSLPPSSLAAEAIFKLPWQPEDRLGLLWCCSHQRLSGRVVEEPVPLPSCREQCP